MKLLLYAASMVSWLAIGGVSEKKLMHPGVLLCLPINVGIMSKMTYSDISLQWILISIKQRPEYTSILTDYFRYKSSRYWYCGSSQTGENDTICYLSETTLDNDFRWKQYYNPISTRHSWSQIYWWEWLRQFAEQHLRWITHNLLFLSTKAEHPFHTKSQLIPWNLAGNNIGQFA